MGTYKRCLRPANGHAQVAATRLASTAVHQNSSSSVSRSSIPQEQCRSALVPALSLIYFKTAIKFSLFVILFLIMITRTILNNQFKISSR